MTIIAGLEHNGKVYVGSDSAASDEDTIDIIDRPKIFKLANKLIIGVCGEFAIGQAIQAQFNCKKIGKSEKWLYTGFVPEIKRILKKTELDELLKEQHWDILIGFKEKIYVMQMDHSILRSSKGYSAVGNGQPYALGSLYSTSHIDDPIKRINLALEAASAFSTRCSPPFHILEL